MRINSIDINRFGRFKNFSLSFEDGFNVLYGENEQGKSTIMAFIRMMLYGSACREKDLSKNIRRKYAPWDGSKMSGSMEFIHEGVRYRLEKTFGATPRNDIVKLWNQSTNETEQLNEQKEIGRRFFGMSEDTFEKSVFIGQIASVINTEKDKENEIIQKLQNLASSGDETQSFNLVESRLQAAAEKIKSKGGRIGILDRLKQAKVRLDDQKAEAIAMEAEKERMQKTYQELLGNKNLEDKNLEEKNNMLEKMRLYKKYCDLQRMIIRDEEAGNLEKELNEANKSLVNGDFKVDPAFIEESRKQLQELVHLHAVLQSKSDELSEKEKSTSDSIGEKTCGIQKEDFEPVSEQYKKILSELEQVRTMQFSLQKEELAMKEAILFETVLQENDLQMEDYQNQIKQLQGGPEPPPDADRLQKKNHFPIAGSIAGGIFLIAFLLAGYLAHPLFYAGGILPAVFLAALWIRYSKRISRQQDDGRIAADAIKEKTRQVQAGISFYQKQWNELFQKQKRIRQERSDNDKADQRSSADIRLYAETLKNSIGEITGRLETEQAKISEAFTRFQASSYEELKEKYVERQNSMNREMDAVKELKDRREHFNLQLEELKIKLHRFVAYFGRVKTPFDSDFSRSIEFIGDIEGESRKAQDSSEPDPSATAGFLSRTRAILDAAKNLLEELNRQFYTASNLLLILEEKKKELQAALAGRPILLVRQEFEAIKSRYDRSETGLPEQEPTGEEIAAIEKHMETIANNRNAITIALAQMKSEMAQAFLDKPELSMIEDQLISNEKQQTDCQTRYEALILAKTQLEQAFLEMQRTFGPMVNKKTADIFSRITSGKYQELLVSKDLNISFRDPLMNTTQEWQYLSGGTIDQVYFSLRLAISGFLADQTGGLPLFIDDAFLQYDDSRTKQSMLFLEDYSKSQQAQILFFTCHRSLCDQCGADTNRIDLSI